MLSRSISLNEKDITNFYSLIKVNIFDLHSCHRWIGNKVNGYGRLQISCSKNSFVAHRISYYLHYGDLPRSKVIDHICKNPSCVNPYHLRPLTNVENVMLGTAPAANNARKIFCKRKHEFTPENTYRYKGVRMCKQCRKIYAHNYEKANPRHRNKK